MRKAFPEDILEKYRDETMTFDLRIGPDGKVFHVNFIFFKSSSPLYNIDIKIYSDMEDIIKSTFRFNIPDRNISNYPLTMSPFVLSQLKDDKQLFSPLAYKDRTNVRYKNGK